MYYEFDLIGERIKSEREKKGWTQKDLAARMNCTNNQISRYEIGTAKQIPLDVLFMFCKLFECELGYLLGEEDYSDGTKLAGAIEEQTCLTPETVKHIHDYTKRKYVIHKDIDKEKEIFNRLLSHEDFAELFCNLVDLDEIYEKYKASTPSILCRYDKSLVDKAFEIYENPIDYEHDESIVIDDDIAEILKQIDECVDKSIEIHEEYLTKARVLRYELSENFRRILDNLYPLHYNK